MKQLKDSRQFDKTLELFDNYKENNILTCSSLAITQALKACAYTSYLQRGSNIHQLVSSRLKNEFYISALLIHLLYMQCSDVANAQSLFDSTEKKILINAWSDDERIFKK
ncbi:unnamed protein product [Rotaria magnacalcarata]|uniref:Uncharacterized protein n=1 Tax=Rotaria magnacalcarata TaxID=392030 RepID=A0A816BS10_9BILA|nr:unnamed protein product [Rotaria magnacalcarata]